MRDRSGSPAGSSRGRSWLPSLSLPGPTDYVSVRATVGIVLALGVGVLLGGFVLPAAGRMIGLVGAALAIGVGSARRRYVEVAAAGVAVGGVSAMLNHALLAAGSGQSMAAVGVSAGFGACLGGYYAGRRLRARLGIEAA